jgi:hypothetical protein
MTIYEPMTLATDYIVAIATAIFAVLAWQRGARLWAFMFAFTAAGAFLGGTYHGTENLLWWKPTVYAIGLASFFLLLAVTPNRAIHALALVQFMVYATWMIGHDSFLWVIVDYGISLIVVLSMQLFAWVREQAASAPWLVGSVVVSAIAAGVQQVPSRWHNDIYHVVQLGSLWLMYRGAMVMSAGNAMTEQPAIKNAR